jgi:hypothetical protein
MDDALFILLLLALLAFVLLLLALLALLVLLAFLLLLLALFALLALLAFVFLMFALFVLLVLLALMLLVVILKLVVLVVLALDIGGAGILDEMGGMFIDKESGRFVLVVGALILFSGFPGGKPNKIFPAVRFRAPRFAAVPTPPIGAVSGSVLVFGLGLVALPLLFLFSKMFWIVVLISFAVGAGLLEGVLMPPSGRAALPPSGRVALPVGVAVGACPCNGCPWLLAPAVAGVVGSASSSVFLPPNRDWNISPLAVCVYGIHGRFLFAQQIAKKQDAILDLH